MDLGQMTQTPGKNKCPAKFTWKNVVGCVLSLSNPAHVFFRLLPLRSYFFIFSLTPHRKKVIYVGKKVRKIPGSENFRKISGICLKFYYDFALQNKYDIHVFVLQCKTII